jgi:hypothetical protein
MLIKRISIFLGLISLFSLAAMGQVKKVKPIKKLAGKNQALSVGLDIPVGDFFHTHWMGAGADYSWSNNRLGVLEIMPVKLLGFIANGGVDYYFGKKEIISSYPYKYPGYLYLHTYAGVICNPGKKTNIYLTAGPAISFYDGNVALAYGVNLAGSVYIFHNQKIAVTPGINFIKEKNADLIGSAFLKATLAF